MKKTKKSIEEVAKEIFDYLEDELDIYQEYEMVLWRDQFYHAEFLKTELEGYGLWCYISGNSFVVTNPLL